MSAIKMYPQEKTYHVALLKGGLGNNHRKSTVVVQMREDVDCLSPEIWRYIRQTYKTKKEIHAVKDEFLAWINDTFDENFKTIIID